MATVNIGSLKFNWKGAYNGSTAYAIDDVTEYNGSSYICILASTGNLPTNTTYFQPMATKGTDGTDVGTTLTTQGDILYRDGSGLQRLAKGTASQVLKMNTAANAPEWGNLSSDWVHLHTATSPSGNTASMSVDGYYTSDYKIYKYFLYGSGQAYKTSWLKCRMNFGGSAHTGSEYDNVLMYSYRNTSSGSTGNNQHDDGANKNYMPVTWWSSGDTEGTTYAEVTIIDPQQTSGNAKIMTSEYFGHDNGNTLSFGHNASRLDAQKTTASTGMTFFPESGNGFVGAGFKIQLYGLKG